MYERILNLTYGRNINVIYKNALIKSKGSEN